MTTMLLTRVFPPQVGGSGRWFWELYRRLPREEYVIAAGEYPGAREFDRSHDLQIERMPLDFRSWGTIAPTSLAAYSRAAWRLRRLVRRHDATRLHAGCALPEGWLAMRCRRRLGLPYAVYVHGEELRVFRSSRELTWMARRVYRHADLVIANSQNTARLLRESWPVSAERLEVHHPGVDTTCFRPAPPDAGARRQLGWDDRPVILTVGRLQRRKGHDVLIRALPAIRQRVPRVLYAIVGDGEERAALQCLVDELGLGEHVRFHGSLGDADMLRAYQQCELFALPNREVDGDFEGFGIVLLEAQACGRPVLAGQSGGTPETISPGRTGEIVDCRRPDTLAEVAIHLLSDAAVRGSLGAAARRWVLEQFDWTAVAPKARAGFMAASRPAGGRRDAHDLTGRAASFHGTNARS
ncbi:MAG: glycosyltransferase family 4 protein [Gemmataceae bacterium]|nr:glycosyltransferase family 4 protein [Gemmataceae bacterium]